MATQFKNVRETITANGDSTIYRSPRGGVVVLSMVRTAGSIDFSLEISLDGTFVPFRDANGSLVTGTMNGTTEHYGIEFLSHVDVDYKVVFTNNSSGSVDLRLGRTTSE